MIGQYSDYWKYIIPIVYFLNWLIIFLNKQIYSIKKHLSNIIQRFQFNIDYWLNNTGIRHVYFIIS